MRAARSGGCSSCRRERGGVGGGQAIQSAWRGGPGVDLECGIAAGADVEPEVESADEGLDEREDLDEEAAEVAADGQLPQHVKRLHALICLRILENHLQGQPQHGVAARMQQHTLGCLPSAAAPHPAIGGRMSTRRMHRPPAQQSAARPRISTAQLLIFGAGWTAATTRRGWRRRRRQRRR